MKWRVDLEEWADEYFLPKGLIKKKTFGCPSYYSGKKLFAFLYEDSLGVKLSPEEVLKKIAENPEKYAHFNPGDGIMKNWLLITCPDAAEYEHEKGLIEEAFAAFLK